METLLKRLAYGWHGPILVDQGFLSHLGWSFAVPLLGYWIGGRRWLRIFGAAWAAYAIWRELIEEALDATTISDLASRIVPVLVLVAIDLARTRAPALQRS
jgi:hypothetical protein